MSPFEPPALPPAGWYQDPEYPRQQRWWDGQAWAASQPSRLTDDLPEVGDLIGGGFRRMQARWRALGVIALITTVPSGVLQVIGLRQAFKGVEIVDGELIGWSNDRVGPLLVVGGVMLLASLLSTVAAPLLMLDDHDNADVAPSETATTTTESEVRAGLRALGRSFGVVPRLIGWTALLGLIAMVAMVVVILLGAAIGPFVLFIVLALIPLMVWVGVRLAFLTVSIIDQRGAPYRRSSAVSDGRFWAVVGRLMLIVIIVFGIGMTTNVATSVGGGGNPGMNWQMNSVDSGVNLDLGEAVDITAVGLIANAAGSLVAAVVGGGMSSAAFARLYRTRNHRDPALYD